MVQRTSWHNADIALRNLNNEGLLDIKRVAQLTSLEHITNLIRPAGFFQTKPKRICEFAKFI